MKTGYKKYKPVYEMNQPAIGTTVVFNSSEGAYAFKVVAYVDAIKCKVASVDYPDDIQLIDKGMIAGISK